MARKPTSVTFLDDAEKIIREQVVKNPELLVYRGPFPHEILQSTYEFETIVVGMSDDKDSAKPPSLVVMQVWLDSGEGARVVFNTGAAGDVSIFCHREQALED